MSGEINWGPEIAVKGKKPEWLEEDCTVDIKSLDSDRWYSEFTKGLGIGAQHIGWYRARSIRLPADHPHYATKQPRTAPSGGEVGPEVAGVHDLREARRQDAVLWDRMEALVRALAKAPAGPWPHQADARAIVALLPEPVDGDLVEARRLAHDFAHDRPEWSGILEGDHDSSPAVTHLLAAIKRGRALEKEAGR